MQGWRGYFDANATTPLRSVARDMLIDANDQHWANPGSPYSAAARTHRMLGRARAEVAEILGLDAGRVVFLSGATEANNMVFSGMRHLLGGDRLALVSAIEHPSVLEPAAAHFGNQLRLIPVSGEGIIDRLELERQLDGGDVALVSVMAANNETGVLQPWREVAALCRDRGVAFHCDASQWIGKESSDGFADCDFVSACAHKFGGPKGTGLLITSDRWGRLAGMCGGGQEHNYRAGTENCPSVLAMVAALREAISEDHSSSGQWSRDFSVALIESLPGCRMIAANAPRLWNTVAAIMPGFKNTRWVSGLDRKGFQVSTGSACASGSEGPSHVLRAMGISAGDAKRAIRISSGWWTQRRDWFQLLEAIQTVYGELGSEPPSTAAVIQVE